MLSSMTTASLAGRSGNASYSIPKTIWILWFQGLENAPEVVKTCYASWQSMNPGWTVRLIDMKELTSLISVEPMMQTKIAREQQPVWQQALSDYARINLLATYGGVWVDATSFCSVPLDTWLPDHAQAGFFAFDRSAEARIIDSWFLASSIENPLTVRLKDMVNAYWQTNPELERRPNVSRFVHALAKSPATTGLWFTPFVTRVLKVYPYMWFAFLFTELIRQDAQARQIWESTRKMSALGPHNLQEVGLTDSPHEDVKREIDERTVPVYKLNWRVLKDGTPDDSVAAYLFRSILN